MESFVFDIISKWKINKYNYSETYKNRKKNLTKDAKNQPFLMLNDFTEWDTEFAPNEQNTIKEKNVDLYEKLQGAAKWLATFEGLKIKSLILILLIQICQDIVEQGCPQLHFYISRIFKLENFETIIFEG